MGKAKNCPLLEKYYIPDSNENLEDWQRKVCTDCCPLQDLCIFDIEGRTPPILKEKLKNATIPCPHCQKDAVYTKEVKIGERISGLYKNEDGDWTCLYCGFTIFKSPLFYKIMRPDKGKSRKRSRKLV